MDFPCVPVKWSSRRFPLFPWYKEEARKLFWHGQMNAFCIDSNIVYTIWCFLCVSIQIGGAPHPLNATRLNHHQYVYFSFSVDWMHKKPKCLNLRDGRIQQCCQSAKIRRFSVQSRMQFYLPLQWDYWTFRLPLKSMPSTQSGLVIMASWNDQANAIFTTNADSSAFHTDIFR